MSNWLKVVIYLLVSALLLSCAPPESLNFEHQGLINCFRLDREPVDPEKCGQDLGGENFGMPNQGNYHSNLDEPMTSNILIQDMDSAQLSKLPVSNCLWTAGGNDGNGNRVSLYWEAYLWLSANNEEDDALVNGFHSSCRFDPPFDRIPAFANLGQNSMTDQCFADLNAAIVTIDEPIDFNQLKSTCDMDIYGINLYEHTKPADDFGLCVEFNEDDLNNGSKDRVGDDVSRGLSGSWKGNNQVSACAPLIVPGLVNMRPERDVMLSVGLGGSDDNVEPTVAQQSLLYPQIMTVMNTRKIGRPLEVTQSNLVQWQTEVLVDEGAGQQKWLENFSENIRVKNVRVFDGSGAGERVYFDLTDAVLRVYDPDDEIPGPAATCQADGDWGFDVIACQLDATPTYRIVNLSITDLISLSNPLVWEIELANDNTNNMFIEFTLDSTFKTSEAAILAEPFTVDFGGILPTLTKQQLITVTNVGNGPYMVDQVGIDPNYGQAYAFTVERLDDPIMFPYFIYLEPTGEENEYRVDYQDLSNLSAQIDVREFETHATARVRHNNNVEIEVESEAVMLQGHVAVAQSQNPSFDGSLRLEDRIYPFRYPVYQTWQLPYLLKPGEQRTVMVNSKPSHIGEFKGKVNISGYPFHAPGNLDTISVFLDSYGMTGPMIEFLPKSLSFPRRGGNDLQVVVINPGDVDLNRSDVSVIDADSTIHSGEAIKFNLDSNIPGSNLLGPGDSELIEINYNPGCFSVVPIGGYHRASLKIETDIGSFLVPLSGDPIQYASSDSSCIPGG